MYHQPWLKPSGIDHMTLLTAFQKRPGSFKALQDPGSCLPVLHHSHLPQPQTSHSGNTELLVATSTTHSSYVPRDPIPTRGLAPALCWECASALSCTSAFCSTQVFHLGRLP